MDLVIERVEPSSGVGLGRPVKRPLQDLDLVCCGGSRHEGTHRTLPCAEAHRRSRGPSLTGGCVVRPARAVLRPPPTPTRHDTHFPAETGYRTRHSGSTRRPPGRGGPPQFPPSPSERSTPHTPESPSRLRFQALHRFHGLHPDSRARHSLIPPEGGDLTTRQASLDAADRSVASPKGLSTLGFDARRFPLTPPACYRASWQLPGPDSHRQATTSLRCQLNSTASPPSSGRTTPAT